MPDRQHLHILVDPLPESEVLAAERYLEFLKDREAPVDAEMLARIDESRAHPSPGIAHHDILKEIRAFEVCMGTSGSR
jgi:hypothetical protein